MSNKTLVNELDKLVEDSNIYNKEQSKTQKELNEENEVLRECIESELEDVTVEGIEITVDDAANYYGKMVIKGNTEQNLVLPPGYTALKYIESTGTQYIDTGINADSNKKIIIDFQYTNISNETMTNMFAINVKNNNYYRFHLMIQSSSFRFFYGETFSVSSVICTDIGERDTKRHKFEFDMQQKKVIQDGRTYKLKDFKEFDTGSNLFLFSRNFPQGQQVYNSSRLYSCSIYDNSILVRDFIPCKNPNNEIGLYDLVTQSFFSNQGTGDFVASDEEGKIIHVVTGNNIINVNNTQYPLDLKDIKLCKIKNYQDIIFFNMQGNKYYNDSLEKNTLYYKNAILKLKLTSDANWNIIKSNNNYTVFQTQSYNNLLDGRYKGILTYCTHFRGWEVNDVYNIDTNSNYNIVGVAELNKLRIKVRTSDFPTIIGFKEFLNNNNVELYAVATSSEYSKIIDSALASQFYVICEHMKLTKGTNNITITPEDLAPEIELTYKKSNSIKLQKLQEEVVELKAMVLDNS